MGIECLVADIEGNDDDESILHSVHDDEGDEKSGDEEEEVEGKD